MHDSVRKGSSYMPVILAYTPGLKSYVIND